MVKQAERKTVVLEALSMFAAKGATREDIFSLIEADLYGETVESKRKSLSNALGRLVNEYEEAVLVGGRYYLKEHAPVPTAVIYSNGNGAGRKADVAPYAGKRSGKTISIYKSPLIINDAIALAFLIDEQWYKMPLFGSLRICVGQGDPPMWSPDQEMYRGVVKIRITHKGGIVSEEHTSSSDIITIAPEE